MSNFATYVSNLEKTCSDEERLLLAEARSRFRLAAELLDIRLARGLSQRDLARVCGIPQSEISRIESGNANPTIKSLHALGSTLGIELTWQTAES